MKLHKVHLAFMGVLLLAFAFVPQQPAQAKTCYDQNKEPIPCPKSGYVLTQEAKNLNAASVQLVPATDTPTATPTETPLPPPTQQAQVLAVAVATAVCPSVPAAVPANPVPPPSGGPNASLLFPALLGGGGL